MKLLKSFCLIGIFTLFITSSIFAQQPGSLTGQVYDSLGGTVSGATVIAVDSGAKEKSAVTNKEGSFTIKGLAPGKYTVRVVSPNFGLYENSEIVIAAGEEQDLTVALSVESIKEVVDVDTSNGVSTDNENNASATVLKGKDLDALPDDPDDLEAALQALAGPSAGPNGGQIYIDGFTGGRMPPKESIREIRINSNPFSAEFDRLGFGRIEILTKPGSDKFRGSAFFNFNDESLNSRNPFALNRAPSQSRFYGGNVSGPIQKKKSSFFVDFSNRDVDDNAVVNANILDSSFNIVPFRQDITRPTKRLSFSPRIDYQLNNSNTLVARYSYTRNKTENQGIGDFSLPSRAYQSSGTENEFRLTETAIINPKTVNETRFEYERSRREVTGDNTIPTINVSGSFTGGGAQIGLNYNNQDYFELQNYTTTSLGKNNRHSVKFGGRLRYSNTTDRSESGFGGTFTFAGVRDPLTGALIYSSIEQYRQKLLGNTNPIFNPSQFSITAGNPVAGVKQYDLGIFATDDWKVRQDLTLSFGLRYETQNNISDNFNFAPRLSFAYSP
ncbi:MAG: TonB-dependent receptor domain-containing protein, partial [Pyrinomonadaceae bacterium]